MEKIFSTQERKSVNESLKQGDYEAISEKWNVAKAMLPADAYTYRAKYHLKCIEELRLVKQAIIEGDQKIFDVLLGQMLDNQLTWGDHIRRYIFDVTGESYWRSRLSWLKEEKFTINDITDEQLRDFILTAFEKNDMKDRGSIDPQITTSSLKKNLKRWLSSPVTAISRNTCFLFCFGLNADEAGAAYLLEALREPTFNPRDYKEAIYYYCLCNGEKFSKVEKWLHQCDEIKKKIEIDKTKDSDLVGYTKLLKNELEEIALATASMKDKDIRFTAYLQALFCTPAVSKQSKTRAYELKKIYEMYAPMVSDRYCEWIDRRNEKQCYDEFEQCLKMYSTDSIQISDTLMKLIDSKILKFPALTSSSLEKKIGSERSSEIKREDILTLVFLYCGSREAGEFRDSEGNTYEYTRSNYAKRKARFLNMANTRLERCGFSDVYLLNPYELFLTVCLLQPDPMTYYLAAWKYSNR